MALTQGPGGGRDLNASDVHGSGLDFQTSGDAAGSASPDENENVIYLADGSGVPTCFCSDTCANEPRLDKYGNATSECGEVCNGCRYLDIPKGCHDRCFPSGEVRLIRTTTTTSSNTSTTTTSSSSSSTSSTSFFTNATNSSLSTNTSSIFYYYFVFHLTKTSYAINGTSIKINEKDNSKEVELATESSAAESSTTD